MNLIYLLLISLTLSLTGCANPSATTRMSDAPAVAQYPNATPHHIVLLLPFSGHQANAGQAIREGFLAAYYQQKPANLSITMVDTNESSSIETAYQKAVQQGADFIVGPLDKKDVAIIDNMSHLAVPTLALNYTSPSASKQNAVYEFGLSPTDEAKQVAEKAWQSGYHSALMITPTGDWGQGIAHAFQERFEALGGRVVDSMSFSDTKQLAPKIRQLLQVKPDTLASKKSNKLSNKQQRRQDANVIFLAAPPAIARQINPLLKFYYAGGLPVYSTSLVYSGKPSPTADHDLNGIIFPDMPLVLNPSTQAAPPLPQKSAAENARLFALGVDAYRLATRFDALYSGQLNGVTGNLFVDSQRRVTRQLQWAQFRDGQPASL
jgi:outer membrane PBP1 activator LpoA protein